MAAIAQKITIRAGITSSAGTALVSHEYTAHDNHSTVSSAAPCNTPTQLRCSERKPVTWGESEDEDQVEEQLQRGDALLVGVPALRRHTRRRASAQLAGHVVACSVAHSRA